MSLLLSLGRRLRRSLAAIAGGVWAAMVIACFFVGGVVLVLIGALAQAAVALVEDDREGRP